MHALLVELAIQADAQVSAAFIADGGAKDGFRLLDLCSARKTTTHERMIDDDHSEDNRGLPELPGKRYHRDMFAPGTEPIRPVSEQRLKELLSEFRVVSDLNMPEMTCLGIQVGDHAFRGCNFTHARLDGCQIESCTFEMCFFDFSELTGLSFHDVKLQNCVFACSTLVDVAFTGSNIIQCNFNGVRARGLKFDDCDLLHTRFDTAELNDVVFTNCNVKETRFINTDTQSVRFEMANAEDAIFVTNEGW